VGGLHAQLASSAELAAWARLKDVLRDDVRRALWEDRSLAKTWAMRGTLHILSAGDVALFTAALGTQRFRKPYWLRAYGLTERDLDALIDAVAEALDGRLLTRRELAGEVAQSVGGHVRERLESSWGEFLKPAAFAGVLCFGPSRGQVTFTRPDGWLRTWKEYPQAEARHEVLRRYLKAHGPSGRDDFTWWMGLQPGELKTAWTEAEGELVEVGPGRFLLSEDAETLSKRATVDRVRLLPAFDPYLLGHRERSHLVEARHSSRVYRKQGWISPAIAVDCRVSGVWAHVRKGKRLEVTAQPFTPLARRVKELIAEEAQALGRFLGAPAGVRFA
jgi:hypothetical protein